MRSAPSAPATAVLPRSSIGDALLPSTLEARGWTVTSRVIYETTAVSTPPAAAQRPAGRGVRRPRAPLTVGRTSGGSRLAGPLPERTRVIAGGPTTALTARRLGIARLRRGPRLSAGVHRRQRAGRAGHRPSGSAPARRGERMTPRPSITERPRRLRRTPALRRLVRETTVDPSGLILPVFVREGLRRARTHRLDARGRSARPVVLPRRRDGSRRGRGRRAHGVRRSRGARRARGRRVQRGQRAGRRRALGKGRDR